MDTGNGRFEILQQPQNDQPQEGEALQRLKDALEQQHPNHGGWFQEGEIVSLKGSRFRVKRIKPTEITLKLLKRSE
jgi:hypothetical protein